MLRATFFAGIAVGASGCANDVMLTQPGIPPMMLMSNPATANVVALQPPIETATQDDLGRKSLAAKVLTARALEIVTGFKTDPARLSEHD